MKTFALSKAPKGHRSYEDGISDTKLGISEGRRANPLTRAVLNTVIFLG